MNVVIFLLILSVIVAIHEFGHLMAAKYFSVYCYEYAIGMGPQLLKWKKKETVYSLRLIPMGGFVAMAGAPEDDAAYPDIEVPKGRHLSEQAPYKKVIIMLAGVIMNFLLAWVLLSLCLAFTGRYQAQPKAMVGKIQENSPAQKAGLMEGDIIKEIQSPNGKITKPQLFSELSQFQSSETYTLKVERKGKIQEIKLQPQMDQTKQRYLIGISAQEPEIKEITWWNMGWYGALSFFEVFGLMLTSILNLFRGIGLQDLSGPVGIYKVTSSYVSLGWIPVLFLMAQLSLNVGIFNLLPLPVLDGGQIVMVLIEKMIGRPLKEKYKLWVMLACWAILISLMLYATWNDIFRTGF